MSKIVFNMPYSEYEKQPGIRGSSIKQMAKSPMEYWAHNVSSTPPERKTTAAMQKGTAYDTRVTAGLDAFEAAFTKYPTPESTGKTVLYTVDDIQKHLTEAGKSFLKSAKKADLAVLVDPEAAVIWDEYKAQWEVSNTKEILPDDVYDEVVNNVAMLEKHLSSFRSAFPGLAHSTGIFWKDPETGLDCKCLVDNLSPFGIDELKTISSTSEKDFETACIHEIGNRRYNLSAVHYMRGLQTALQDPDLVVEGSDEQKNLVNSLKTMRPGFTFHFILTGDFPEYYSRGFSRDTNGMVNEYWYFAEVRLVKALKDIAHFTQIFGTDPWLKEGSGHNLLDLDCPMWMLQKQGS